MSDPGHIPLLGIEILDEDPPEGWLEAAEVGIADIEAGRSTICYSLEEFERLLAEEAAHPQAS